MTELWPENLMDAADASSTVKRLLNVAASQLFDRTERRLVATVETTFVNDDKKELGYRFVLNPRGNPSYTFELFVARTFNADFPVVVENYHLEARVRHCENAQEFESHLKDLFGATKTREIVQIMAADGRPDREKYIPFFVGPVVYETPQPKHTALVLNDVAGWIDMNQLGKLAMDIDDDGSAYRSFSNGVTVTVTMLEEQKIQVSREVADHLRAQASMTLKYPKGRAQDDDEKLIARPPSL